MNELITCSLIEGNVSLLLQFPKVLLTKFETEVVEWIVGYLGKYRKPPTPERLREQFDMFVPIVSSDPLEDIYEQSLIKRRNIHAREFILGIQDRLKDGEDPLPHITTLYNQLKSGASNVTHYTTFDRTSYYRRPASYPYGIDQIDRFTGGISQGDLVYTVGRLGTGKTTFALWLVNRWLLNGRRVLMVSNENRAEDVIVKVDSFIGGFNPLKKRTTSWTGEDLDRLATVSFIASHLEGEMMVPNSPVKDTKELYGLIHTHNPDIVVIDGIYLMGGVSGNSNWEKITEVSRTLKQIADGEGVPILGIHQANRGAIGKHMEIENIAYADALAQDADLVLSVNAEDDDSLFLECLKSRWGKSGWGFFLKIYFESMTVKILEAPSTITEGEDDGEA